jgi:rhodanese-related sulfurtransferase
VDRHFSIGDRRPSVGDMTHLDAAAFFAARLAFQTDVSDVHAAMGSDSAGFVLVDTRSPAAWAGGRIPGARHLPTAQLPGDLDPAVPVVTYCWGPGCNGATRAALALARAGFAVREMIGGLEYWTREGLPVATDTGTTSAAPDPLTAPCGC